MVAQRLRQLYKRGSRSRFYINYVVIPVVIQLFCIFILPRALAATYTANPTHDYYMDMQSQVSCAGARSQTNADSIFNGDFVDGTVSVAAGIVCQIDRGADLFNVSITAGSTLTSGTLQYYLTNLASDAGGTHMKMHVVSLTPASNTNDGTVSDYSKCGTTDLVTPLDTSSLTLNAYNTFNLNAAGLSYITLNGYTNFCVLAGADFDNVFQSSGTMRFRHDSIDKTAGNKAILTINYTAPGGGSSSSSAGTGSTVTSCAGTGCTLDSTGSILITNGACDHYATITNASGTVLQQTCDQWSTSIKIPAIKAIQSQFAYILFAPIPKAIHDFLILFLIFFSARWLFRIITLRRPKRYKR